MENNVEQERRRSDMRLENIELGLAAVLTKLEGLIRLEERHDNSVRRIDSHQKKISSHENRVQSLEHNMNSNTQAVETTKRLGWLCISLVLAAVVYGIKDIVVDL